MLQFVSAVRMLQKYFPYKAVTFIVFVCGVEYLITRGIGEKTKTSVKSLGATAVCNKIPGLSPKQRLFCRSHPDVMVAIGEGAKMSSSECRFQFRNMRWNCSSVNSEDSMFGYGNLGGNKEAAFLYALTSAGVTFAITQACGLGSLFGCDCDKNHRNGQQTSAGWKWGGCSSDIRYGVKYARMFMDAREITNNARSLMNVHNNRAGRKSVKDNMKFDCKCHGVSGACTIKTCWTTLPAFRDIGDVLQKRYKKAKFVVPYLGGRWRNPISLFINLSKPSHRKPRRSHLVYLEKSPSFCDYDSNTGSVGTVGRSCNRTSDGTDGCDLLCCGRGYNTHEYIRVWQCFCKFYWCCRVECIRCSEKALHHRCK